MENNSIGNAERNGKGVKFERIRRITGYLVGLSLIHISEPTRP